MKARIHRVGPADIRAVAELFSAVRGPEETGRLLDEMLTPAEVRDLALRWRLVQRLHAGQPQRRIAAELCISLCKITRGSRVLKRPDGVVRRLLGNGRTEEG